MGIKSDKDVVEDAILEPLTDYPAIFKAKCENFIKVTSFVTTIIRPATVCGYSDRLVRFGCKHFIK